MWKLRSRRTVSEILETQNSWKNSGKISKFFIKIVTWVVSKFLIHPESYGKVLKICRVTIQKILHKFPENFESFEKILFEIYAPFRFSFIKKITNFWNSSEGILWKLSKHFKKLRGKFWKFSVIGTRMEKHLMEMK